MSLRSRSPHPRLRSDVSKAASKTCAADDAIRPDDSASQVGQGSVTSSSIGIQRLELSAKRAAILAEASLASEQYDLEVEQAKLKQKMQQLDVKRRLAVLEAEDEVYCNADANSGDDYHSSVVLQDSENVDILINNGMLNTVQQHVLEPQLECTAPRTPENDPEITFKSNLNPAVKEFVPDSTADVVSWIKQGQMQNAQLIEAIRLPTAQLAFFNGDPLSYWPFIRAFENCIASSVVDDGAKLIRLVHYCTGPARKVIEGCMVMPPAAGYARALELLNERFGNQFIILHSWIQKITNGAALKNNDRSQLQQFADDLKCCRETLLAMNACHEINNQSTLLKIIERLPPYLQSRWKREVGLLRAKSKCPDINDVVKFVVGAAAEANDPVYGRLNCTGRMEMHCASASAPKGTSLVTGISQSEDGEIGNGKSCMLCSGRHALFKCSKFISMKLDDRLKYASDKKLCYNCLSVGHVSSKCKSNYTCQVPGCNKKHSKYLHRVKPVAENTDSVTVGVNDNVAASSVESVAQCSFTGAGAKTSIALPIVPVVVSSDQQDVVVSTYALLDSGSTNSFCSAQLADQLRVTGKKSLLSITTLDKADTVSEMQTVSLQVMGVNTGAMVALPTVFVRPKIHVNGLDTIRSTDLTQWSHLSNITFPDVSLTQVSLLIGQDVPEALIPLEVSRANVGDPYAVRTLLGWCLNGPINENVPNSACVNFLSAEPSLEEQVERFWKLETSEQHSGELAYSVNDRRTIAIWKQSIKITGGHYEMAIPFKARPNFPDNKAMAVKHLESLRKRLLMNPKILHEYKTGIDDVLSKGYATKLSDEHKNRDDGAVWYLPHHYVVHPRKQKLRIVFDCAARYEGVSLNDCVLQGPDLTNKLVGVLLRFRQEHVAIMADIEAMFCQVRVAPKDQDVLRFLWWPDGDMNQEREIYKMVIHLFGGVWSPSCANFALLRTADDNRSEFPQKVIDCVQRNFYVDDFLKSVPDEIEAAMVVSQLTQLLSRGGFHLTKWVSSSREVLRTVAEDDRAQDVKTLDLSRDTLPAECALGVFWDVETDSLGFRTVCKRKPFTRRGILSVVSSVYDPLGLLCPFVLPAKLILQELCRKKYGWDDELPPDDVIRWRQWLEDLSMLNRFMIRRCLKPPDTSQVEMCSLHHFCDASQVGYGVVSYVRLEFAEKQRHCSLVLGKSRLAPIKPTTIPRLELMAAVLAVKIDKMLHSELEYEIQESVFWTDSTIVLCYIANHDKRFHTFVANRISSILDGSVPSQWRHIISELNPADDVSRGMRIEELLTNTRWFAGPQFLWEDASQWPTSTETTTDITDLELKKEVKMCAMLSNNSADTVVQRLFSKHSSWYMLKKNVAWLLRAKSLLKQKVHKKQTSNLLGSSPLSVDEIRQAERAIVRYVQLQAYNKEFKLIEQGISKSESQKANRHSDIRKLEPILSTDGILCVGGRLRKADIAEEAKYPMIVPKDSVIAKLIVRHYHEATNHSGREHTLALMRERFWIVKARVVVRAELNGCYQCRKRATQVCTQKMADLPADRVTPNKPPFTYVGVDYFGPFMVKQGRSLVKRYGCLFTCLTTRAVHLEVACSMDTDSFINALRRFICRRGPPEILRSDNGSNFVGAERELRQALNNLSQVQIAECLRQKEITWIFNPPAASHMGGVWERMIRSVRRVLGLLMKEQTLSDETLLTLMCEVESTLNSRPITVVSEDPSDMEPLTPNHLLMMRGSPAPAINEVDRRDTYRRRWKQVQYLSALFWRRWIREYLPALQQRHKWNDAKPNLKVNDVVIVADETMPRNVWPIGRILAVFPGDDGLVRSVQVKTATSVLTRPVSKLCLLESVD